MIAAIGRAPSAGRRCFSSAHRARRRMSGDRRRFSTRGYGGRVYGDFARVTSGSPSGTSTARDLISNRSSVVAYPQSYPAKTADGMARGSHRRKLPISPRAVSTAILLLETA